MTTTLTRQRHLARERKARQRELASICGRPHRDVVERAIVDALRAFLSRDETSLSRPLDPRAILLHARDALLARSEADADAGRTTAAYNPSEVMDALRCRLLVPPAPRSGIRGVA